MIPTFWCRKTSAWRFLERAEGMDEHLMSARLRTACGLPATDVAARVLSWLDSARGSFAPVVGTNLDEALVESLFRLVRPSRRAIRCG